MKAKAFVAVLDRSRQRVRLLESVNENTLESAINNRLMDLLEALIDDLNRCCRECGCTQDEACEGGCYWVEDRLCSQCRPRIGVSSG